MIEHDACADQSSVGRSSPGLRRPVTPAACALPLQLAAGRCWPPGDDAGVIAASRVENGTGKSRPDRLRLSFKPTVNHFREKNRKMGKQNGKTGGNGNGWGVFPTVFTVPVFSRENSRGNSRICRSRLCYLCWKRELLFACVPT